MLNEDGPSLFKKAQEIAKTMDSHFHWPIFFNTTCTMQPVCRHCSWHSGAFYDPDWTRKYSQDEVVRKAIELEKVGIKETHMVSGWMGYEVPEYFCDYIAAIKRKSRLELYGFFGAISRESLNRLKDAGMDGYWTGIEVMNEKAFKYLRPGDSLDARLNTLKLTKELGLKVWSSFLLGVGENNEDIARAIAFLRDLGVDSLMIVPLKPAPFTEMERTDSPNQYWTAKVMAAARIALGRIDIVSFSGMSYIEWGIRAGANTFITSYPWEMEKIKKMRRTLYSGETS